MVSAHPTVKVCSLLSIIFLLAGCGGTAQNSPTTTPRVQRVVFIGDSITACFSAGQPCPGIIGPGLPLPDGWQGINHGMSGATTDGIMSAFNNYVLSPQVWGDGITAMPSVIVLEENTNDFTNSVTPAHTQSNIDSMISSARAAGMMVVVQTMLPTGHVGIDAYDGGYVKTYNAFLGQEAVAGRIVIARTYETIIDPSSCDASGECFALEGMLVDGKHLSEAGFSAAYPAIMAALQRQE